jgi:hypothetical protein
MPKPRMEEVRELQVNVNSPDIETPNWTIGVFAVCGSDRAKI